MTMTLEVTLESTDSGMCILTGKGFNYPPLIFTDPEHVANKPDSDIESATEGPQISSYVGNYCEDCVTIWPRCICKPESDWDDDQNYIVMTQMDSPSDVKNDRHPISDWSDQENFWNGKAYKKSTGPQRRYWSIPTKHNDNDSDWKDNLYPQNYRAETQSQVTCRQSPPGWPKGVRLQSLPFPSKMENHPNTDITKPSEEPMMPQRRKKPHGWSKNVRPSTLVDGQVLNENKEKSEDNKRETEV